MLQGTYASSVPALDLLLFNQRSPKEQSLKLINAKSIVYSSRHILLIFDSTI